VDGMILAAGLGTRLRPLTEEVPKALVTVGGTPMLERIAHRLVGAGVDRLIINVHHHADQIRAFVEARDGFGVDTRLVMEPGSPLETGGGLLNAREEFRRNAPFFLHNVDIICEADLEAMFRAHQAGDPLATLAVSGRDSARMLRFDDAGLQARVDPATGAVEAERPQEGEARDLAFAGIHVVSPRIFDLMTERGAFSIIGPYLRLAGAGHRIEPYDMGKALWLEVGDPERLERARRFMRRGNGEGDG
jgi:MurNAc alpha-1-phosphate uridylyltransferase